MKTAHVIEQLPLWVEGDLAANDLSTVEAHLTQCPECFKAAANQKESQAWLKGAEAPPFTPEDRHQLRLQVMAQIQAESLQKRNGTIQWLKIRPLLVAAASLSLFLVVKSLLHSHPEASVMVAESVQPKSHPLQSEPNAIPPGLAPRVHVRSARLNTPAIPAAAPTLPESTPSRIEFQTSNPNVRIIWLANAKSVPTEPNPSSDRFADPL